MNYFDTKTNPETFSIDRGQTIRYPSNVLFAVNSADRFQTLAQARSVNGPSPFNFAINKNENMLAGSLTRIGLTEFVMPYNIPNVNPATNTIGFVTQDTSGSAFFSTIISVPTAFYSGQDLAVAITQAGEAALIATGHPGLSSFTVTYTPNGYFEAKIDISGGEQGIQMFPVDKPQFNNRKTLFDIMNWTTGIPPATSTFSGIASLKPTDYIDIVCDQLTYNQDVRDSTSQPVNRDVLARIYLANSNSGNIIPNKTFQNGVLQANPSTTAVSTLLLTSPDGINFANFTPVGGASSGLVTDQLYPTILGTSPFTIYRDFATPKYIKWGGEQNIPGYVKVTLYDDRGNVLSSNVSDPNSPFNDNNMPDFQFSALASEN